MFSQVQKILRFCLLAFLSVCLWLGLNQLGHPTAAQSVNTGNSSSSIVSPPVPLTTVINKNGQRSAPFSMPILIKKDTHSIKMPTLVKGNTPPPMPQDIRGFQPLAPLPIPGQ